MSPVDFKKWQCPLSLFILNVPVDFKVVQCRLSNLMVKGPAGLSMCCASPTTSSRAFRYAITSSTLYNPSNKTSPVSVGVSVTLPEQRNNCQGSEIANNFNRKKCHNIPAEFY